MRRLLVGGLGLSLVLWIVSARRGDAQSPAVTPPAAVADLKPAPNSLRFPGVMLGRPVALPDEPAVANHRPAILDQQLRPVAYNTERATRIGPVVWTQSSDVAQPLPLGPVSGTDTPLPAKPQTPAAETPEKLGTPRLIPMPNVSNKPNTVAIPDECDGPNSGSCCDCSGSCGDGCCLPRCLFPLWRPGECFNRPYDIWASGEYLLWWIKSSRVPALVTTSPAGTPREQAGVLGAPGTSVLFGGSLDNDERSGGRFTFGFWFDDEQCCGLESSTFFLGERSVRFGASSPGLPILARPFFNVSTGQEASELVAFPGILAGNVAVVSSSRLWGTELNFRSNWCSGCCWRFDSLLGFRYLGLDESLRVMENLTLPASASLPRGGGIAVTDSFGTHNNFFGGQLGAELELRQARWSLNLLGKVALGNTHEVVNINGNTTFFVPGSPPIVQTGGLLAQPTNIGHFTRDRFAVVPEVGVKLGYQATERLRLFVAYSFLYISDVARPGHQIDRVVNVSQLSSQFGPGTLVGAPSPTVLFKGTDFWAQGISFGLEFRF